MENSLLKKLLPHGIALVLMVVLSFTFFASYTFDGKVLQQDDNDKASASQVEMNNYKAKTGKTALWTGAYFSGMPTVQIHQEVNGNLIQPIFRGVFIGTTDDCPARRIVISDDVYVSVIACFTHRLADCAHGRDRLRLVIFQYGFDSSGTLD